MGWFDSFKKDFRKDYVNKILINSSEAAEAIRHLVENKNIVENKRDLTHTEYWSILLEFIYLYLHLTDRFAVNYGINEGDRRKLIILLADMSINSAVEIYCQDFPEDTKENIKEEYKYNFDISLMEYSKCKKLFPEKVEESSKDTLFWEFGKNIATLLGQVNIVTVMAAHDIASDTLIKRKLDIMSFIKKLR